MTIITNTKNSNKSFQPVISAFRRHRRTDSSPDAIILSSNKVHALAQAKIGSSELPRRCVSPYHISGRLHTLLRLLPELIPPPPNKPLPPTPDESSRKSRSPAPNKPLPPTPDESSRKSRSPAPNKPLPSISGRLEQVFRKQFLPREQTTTKLDSIPEGALDSLPSRPDPLEQRFRKQFLPREYTRALEPILELEEEVPVIEAVVLGAPIPAERLSAETERRVDEYLSGLGVEVYFSEFIYENPEIEELDSQESCLVTMTCKEYAVDMRSTMSKKIIKTAVKSVGLFPLIIVGSFFHGAYEGYRALRKKPYDILENEEKIAECTSKISSANERLTDITKKLNRVIKPHLDKAIKNLQEANEEYKSLRQQKRKLEALRVQKEAELSTLKENLKKKQKEADQTGVPLIPDIGTLKEKIANLTAEINSISTKINELHFPLLDIGLKINKQALCQVIEEIRKDPSIKKRLDPLLISRKKVERHLKSLNESLEKLRKERQEILRKRKLLTLAEKNLTLGGVRRNYLQARRLRSALKQGMEEKSLSVNLKKKKYINQLPIRVQNQKLKQRISN